GRTARARPGSTPRRPRRRARRPSPVPRRPRAPAARTRARPRCPRRAGSRARRASSRARRRPSPRAPPRRRGSRGSFHLDEPALSLVLGDRSEARTPVRAQRALVPPGNPEPEPSRPPFLARIAEARLDERLGETVSGQVGPDAEADAHLVALADEVEEADQLSVVVDDRPQSFA